MRVKRFFAPTMRQAMRQVQEELGPDAAILSRNHRDGGVEVVCALDFHEAEAEQTEAEANPVALSGPDVSGMPTSDRAKKRLEGEDLKRELEAARQRILEGARFESGLGDNAFQKRAQSRQLGGFSEQLKHAEQVVSPDRSHSSSRGAGSHHSSAPAQEQAVLDAMQAEIQGLRELLREQMREQGDMRHPLESMLRRRLLAQGFTEKYIKRLIELSALEGIDDSTQALSAMLQRLKLDLQVVDEELIDRGGVVALMGPTGVGKTTTIGKLAVRYVLKHGPEGLALVTTDCYRIAAYEQLRTFGRILGVPVRVVDERNSMDETLKSLRSKQLILIDTAGLNVRDPNMTTQLNLLNSAKARIRRFLVLPCTSQNEVLSETYDAYHPSGLNGCVLTKLDEARRLGDVLGLVAERRLPLAYLATGQKIPDDLSLVNRDVLIQLLNETLLSGEDGRAI